MNGRNECAPRIGREQGLTLVELMVALVLSLVLMAGALQLFSSSRQTYRLSDSLSAIQESGRYALELLARDIRQAGFTGCIAAPDFSNVVVHDPDVDWQYDFARPIFGYEADRGQASPSVAKDGSPGGAWVNTPPGRDPDAIRVMFGDPADGIRVAGPDPADPGAPLEVDAGPALQSGQALLVTDCARAALFRLTADKASGGGELHGGQPANCSNHLHDGCPATADPNMLKPYAKDVSRVLPLRVSSYFIGNTQREDARGGPIPALFRQTLGPAGPRPIEELVDGVSDLQILYGVAPAGGRSAERFVPADQVAAADWGQVVAVHIGLTIRSTLGVGRTEGADAELFAQTFATTIALRNRTL